MLLAALLWSTGGLSIKALAGYSPWTILSGRSIVSAVFFLVLLRGAVGLPARQRSAVVTGAIAYAAVVTTFVLANRYTTAANAIILQYTSLLWIALLGWVSLRERPTSAELAALVVGGTGVVLCLQEGLTLFAADRSSTRVIMGDGIALFSGFCFALVTLSLRRINKAAVAQDAGEDPGVLMLFYGNVLAALVGLRWLVTEIGAPGVPEQAAVAGWFVLLWLGVGQLGMGYWFYQKGLKTTRALSASLLALVEPIVNPLLVLLLLNEVPSAGTQVGSVLVLAALVLTLVVRQQPARAAAVSGSGGAAI